MEENKSIFYSCSKCGKRLIQRLSNGTWKFLYGRNPKYSKRPYPPVEMYIFGSLKMRCLANGCEHMNTFNFFPGKEGLENLKQSPEAKSPENNKILEREE